jgi:serine/threonine protein kinase
LTVETIADGRYRVEGTIGHGGMAVVYLARDIELGRPVALKVLAQNLADDADLRARFVREARLAARLSHPNVVQVYDAGEEDGVPFIVSRTCSRAGASCRRTRQRRSHVRPPSASSTRTTPGSSTAT